MNLLNLKKRAERWSGSESDLAAADLGDLTVAALEQRGVKRFARAAFAEFARAVFPSLAAVVAQKGEAHWVLSAAALHRLADLGRLVHVHSVLWSAGDAGALGVEAGPSSVVHHVPGELQVFEVVGELGIALAD